MVDIKKFFYCAICDKRYSLYSDAFDCCPRPKPEKYWVCPGCGRDLKTKKAAKLCYELDIQDSVKTGHVDKGDRVQILRKDIFELKIRMVL